jgi:hypothetical protein
VNLRICIGRFIAKMSLKFLRGINRIVILLKKLAETFQNGSYALHSPAEALLFN